MASLHAFALRQSLNLYITHYKRPFASCQIPLPPMVLVFLTKSLPRIKDHKWFIEFNTIDICRTFRRLLGPEAYISIRYDTAQIVITRLRCHFGSCVSTCFHTLQVTTHWELHLSVLHVSFSLAVWGCQVHPYTALFSELCTNPLPEMHIRVGTF